MVRHEEDRGRQQYLRELETMIRFSHEKQYSKLFVRMIAWYPFGKTVCLVMEYLPQGDLYTFLRDRPALDEGESQQVISQVLQGLSMMHDAGFAHRDIKPQNILIQRCPTSTSPGSWWIKLADFGISVDINKTVTQGKWILDARISGLLAPPLSIS
ncbi:kinase-like domain-containing protein [Stachybotrys elegans]|uniref:Kinase-like domain-containing protein n=1 Tax=Stachybotrys elegans TaxID=80388 RepID=A0A8K0WSX9_9HYPO|nr:kinase-like domain-containing protein [Stachybotrys elegans]